MLTVCDGLLISFFIVETILEFFKKNIETTTILNKFDQINDLLVNFYILNKTIIFFKDFFAIYFDLSCRFFLQIFEN